MIAALIARLRRQDGVALVVVMGSLLVVSLTAAALAAAASQTNDSAVRDSSSKRALAAAEAGLHVATERFDTHRTQLAANECLAGADGVTQITVATGVTECPPVSGGADVGDDTGYSYVISLPGAGCRSAPGSVATPTANDRCITSTGIVNGVRRRVQTRLSTRSGAPFFDTAGLIGLDSLTFINSNTVNSGVGSNGTISIGNSVRINGDATYGPDGEVTVNNGGQLNGAQVPRSGSFALDLDPEFEAAEATNDNMLLPASSFEGGNRSSLRLRPPNGTNTVMPTRADGQPTIYYFCNIYLDNSIEIALPPNREVKVFVDSPNRAGSPCSTGGKVTFNNSIRVNWPSSGAGLASNLEFYLAGTGGEDLRLNNSVWVSALFYAPNTTVDLNNTVWVNGAIAAKSILINNSINFTWPDDARTDPGPGRRTAWSGWFECSPRPAVTGDPESGC